MFLANIILVACALALSTCAWPAAANAPRPAPAAPLLQQLGDAPRGEAPAGAVVRLPRPAV